MELRREVGLECRLLLERLTCVGNNDFRIATKALSQTAGTVALHGLAESSTNITKNFVLESEIICTLLHGVFASYVAAFPNTIPYRPCIHILCFNPPRITPRIWNVADLSKPKFRGWWSPGYQTHPTKRIRSPVQERLFQAAFLMPDTWTKPSAGVAKKERRGV